MKYVKLLVVILALAVVILGAVLLYPKLTEQYQPKDTPESKPRLAQKTAPDFTVLDMDGQEVKLSDYFGKPIVINFWATWCGPCRSELPAFHDLYGEYGDKIQFLMVNLTDGNQDTVESVKAFVAENGFQFPVFFDTDYEAAMAYGTYSIPVTVFIGADGAMLDSRVGAMDEITLRDLIEGLLGG